MNYWISLKRYAIDFRREWGGFIYFSAIGALALYFGGVTWSIIWIFPFGLFAARELARDAIQKWSAMNFSPGIDGGTLVNPRVWTFHLEISTTLLQEAEMSLSDRYSKHRRNYRCFDELSWRDT